MTLHDEDRSQHPSVRILTAAALGNFGLRIARTISIHMHAFSTIDASRIVRQPDSDISPSMTLPPMTAMQHAVISHVATSDGRTSHSRQIVNAVTSMMREM